MSASVWPSDDELRQLLDGSLTAARQAELEALLEHDPALHQRLEALAGAHRWPQGVGGTSATAETDVALLAAIGGLKAQAGAATTASDTPQPTMLLNFLTPSDLPGSIGRLGHYEVHELIGTGGFGMVLKAHDPKLNRVVAIKVLSPSLAMHATSRQRFLREAQNGAGVKHEDVVTIYHVDEQHQPPFLVMEYIAGLSLQQLVDRDGPLPLAKVLRIGSQAAEGLAAAHRKGLIHRDIKPSNILLENGVQRVKITDFGLSRAVDEASLTQSGVVAGTPQYMAPEQARGETVDYRSDLFSLGSVLYTMCAGRPAFRADSAFAVLKRVCEDTPRPLREVNPEIPPWLEGIIHKLMAKAPADRFSSAREVADLLDQCLAHVQQPTLVPLPKLAEQCAAKVAPASVSPAKMPEELAHVRSQLAWPGLGVIYAGALNLSLMLIFAPSIIGRSLDAATVLGLGLWGLGSLFTLFAGVAIREPRITWLFYVGAVLGMVMPPGMLIGLPCALWIFWLLAREDVQAALHNSIGQSPASPPATSTSAVEQRLAAARQRVYAPAIGMRIVGLLNLVGIGLLDIWRASSGGSVNAVYVGLMVMIGLTSLVTILGAFAMLRLRHYLLAILAAILCMLAGPSTIIGLPIGIWALVVLLGHDVREAFELAQGKPLPGKPMMAPLPRRQQATAIAVVALVMAPLFCILPAVGVLGYFFTSLEAERPQPLPVPDGGFATSNGGLSISVDLPGLTVDLTSLDYAGAPQGLWQWQSDTLMRSNYGARLDVPPGRYRITAVNQSGERVFEQTVQVTSGSSHLVHVVPQAKRQASERTGPDFSSAGHEPRSIVLSPDGQWLAAGLKSDKWLFTSTDPASKVSPKIVSETVGPIAFSHDGQWIATLTNESDEIAIQSTSNVEEPARTLKFSGEGLDKRYAKRDSAQAMAFSPDGEMLVVACSYLHDKENEEESNYVSWIHRFALDTGKALPPLGPQDGIIEHLAFPATKSDYLVSISNSQLPMTSTTIVWEVATQKIAGRTWDRDMHVDALAVSPQGGWIYRAEYALNNDSAATKNYPGQTSNRGAHAIYVQPLRTRDTTGGFERPRALLKTAGSIPLSLRAHALAVSPNGQWLAIANEQDTIALWQALSPDKAQHVGDLLDAGYQTPVAIAFSRDSHELVLCGKNLDLKRWDLRPWLLAAKATATTTTPTRTLEPEQPPPDATALQKVVLLAEEDLRRARERFAAASITQYEVDEAQAKHLEAQIDYATAIGQPAEVVKHLSTLLDVRRQQVQHINQLVERGIQPPERASAAQAAALKVEHRLRAAEAKASPTITPVEASDD